MINLRDGIIGVVAAAALVVMLPSVASSKVIVVASHHKIIVAGSHHTLTLDCAGGTARIAGSHNMVTLTGGCTRLTVLGSSNTAIVAFGAGARVKFVGVRNEIIWTTPDGKEPEALRVGSDNILKRQQEP